MLEIKRLFFLCLVTFFVFSFSDPKLVKLLLHFLFSLRSQMRHLVVIGIQSELKLFLCSLFLLLFFFFVNNEKY